MARLKKWSGFLIFIIICGVVAVLFQLYRGVPLSDNKPGASISVPTGSDISCLGRLLPGGRILRITAPPGTVIGKLLVHRGQWVNQGEILACLRDHARAVAALSYARKEVLVAKSELDCVLAGEKKSAIEAQQAAVARQAAILRQEETEYGRCRRLYDKQIIASKILEEALTRRDAAHESLLVEKQRLKGLQEIRAEDVALAASKVAAAEEARKVAKEKVELNLIYAPVSGQILDIHTFPGEAIQDSGILELGSGKDMMVEAEVYVGDIGRVKVGAQAMITGDGFKERLKGTVVEITSVINRSVLLPTNPLAFSDKRVVKVLIRLEDSRPVLHLGNHQVFVTIGS
jgi:HlyD family secretion protein